MKLCCLHVYRILLCAGFIYELHAQFPPYRQSRPYGQTQRRKEITEKLKVIPTKKTEVYSSNKCDCGIAGPSALRIVGGEDVRPNFYPWQVGLTILRSRPYCGGTLINDQFVLTAAHCLNEERYDMDNLMVIFGEHDTRTDDDKAFHVAAKKYIPHPKYDKGADVYDIGLVQLAETIPFTSITLPPCMPPAGLEYEGEMGVVSGWGMITDGGKLSPILKSVEVPITNLKACRTKYKDVSEILDNMLCATWEEGGKDACVGDSGGPFLWKDKGRYWLIGVVSWGIGCAYADQPAIYTRVDKFYKWIEKHTKGATMCTNDDDDYDDD